jgi:hypoxanthine-DNA glycosylase
MPEIHPFKPFVPRGATTLIIGTFPPLVQYRDFKFYYPNNTGNRFWIIMEYVFNYKFQYWKDGVAAEERKALFKKEHIAITDMIGKCMRTNGNSSDKNLGEIEFCNVYKLLKNQPAIQKVILTSRTDGDSWQMHKKTFKKIEKQQCVRIIERTLDRKRSYYSEFA